MDSSRVLDVLALARAFVAAGHCKGHVARTGGGGNCLPWHPAAAAFCALGALERAGFELGIDRGSALYHTAEDLLDSLSLEYDMVTFNDAPETTQADVLALFDQAAARVGKS